MVTVEHYGILPNNRIKLTELLDLFDCMNVCKASGSLFFQKYTTGRSGFNLMRSSGAVNIIEFPFVPLKKADLYTENRNNHNLEAHVHT